MHVGCSHLESFLDETRRQAADGTVTPRKRKIASIIMDEASRRSDDGSVTLPSVGDDRGRGRTYQLLVKSSKASNLYMHAFHTSHVCSFAQITP